MATSRAHLHLATEAAARAGSSLRGAIDAHKGYYCAGAVAPDARERSEAAREATHFFRFREPATWGRATSQLFAGHPDLSRLDGLPGAQVAYVAGYLTHLAVDEVFASVCGAYVGGGFRGAVKGLTFAIERSWGEESGAMRGVSEALELFEPGEINTVVDTALLLRLTPAIASAGDVESPAHLIHLLAHAAGSDIGVAEAERRVADHIATGEALFGDDIADGFASRAGDEIDRRLHAYERGKAARYDSPSLRAATANESSTSGETRA